MMIETVAAPSPVRCTVCDARIVGGTECVKGTPDSPARFDRLYWCLPCYLEARQSGERS